MGKILLEIKNDVASVKNSNDEEFTNDPIVVEDHASANAIVRNDPPPVRIKGTKGNARMKASIELGPKRFPR